MNKERFDKFMRSVDEELLEQAQRPAPRRHRYVLSGLAAAACVCLVLVAALGGRPGAAEPDSSAPMSLGVVNPMAGATEEQIAELGYSIPLPENASDRSWNLINTVSEGSMAQVSFLIDDSSYTCRALKTEAPEDISGLYYDWDCSLDWTVGQLKMQLRSAEDRICWLGWYSPTEGTQWCISSENGAEGLMLTAQYIVETLGYDLTVAPADAENVVYSVHRLGELVVGQTSFTVGNRDYIFRMASSPDTAQDFPDISGIDAEFEHSKDVSVAWCGARLSYNEGGSGKIVWFDIVPGILYSLSMESGADEASLITMALSLYEPAQADS